MFSGIIEKTTKALKLEKDNNSLRLTLKTPRGWKLSLGESISIDGTCCTVEKLNTSSFSVYMMLETLRKTTFSNILRTHIFNLEKCLTMQSLIGGHLVSGHIDTTAKVTKIVKEQESKTLTFEISSEFTKYIIHKGSIAVNGVSLTVVTVDKKSFSVSLIPYTLEHTNLGSLEVGSLVNIEVDLVAKYLEKLVIT